VCFYRMVVEIGVTDDPERVGFYSGMIVSGSSYWSTVVLCSVVGICVLFNEPYYE
jgi:hypothetical protein